MSKTEVIHARITPDLKISVEAVLQKIGLSTTDAISLFFHQVVLKRGIPFDVRLPNKKTRQTIKEAQAGKNLKAYASVASMRKALEGK
ncbi:MAG: type II toxin-antitoxin system RelB/DinJ family antitoxin [Bdellovibrionales bacterium]|jgi:DNA-damage-inducible protein J